MLACQLDLHFSSGGASQGAGPRLTECDLSVRLLQPRVDGDSGQLWKAREASGRMDLEPRRGGWGLCSQNMSQALLNCK